MLVGWILVEGGGNLQAIHLCHDCNIESAFHTIVSQINSEMMLTSYYSIQRNIIYLVLICMR